MSEFLLELLLMIVQVVSHAIYSKRYNILAGGEAVVL